MESAIVVCKNDKLVAQFKATEKVSCAHKCETGVDAPDTASADKASTARNKAGDACDHDLDNTPQKEAEKLHAPEQNKRTERAQRSCSAAGPIMQGNPVV